MLPGSVFESALAHQFKKTTSTVLVVRYGTSTSRIFTFFFFQSFLFAVGGELLRTLHDGHTTHNGGG